MDCADDARARRLERHLALQGGSGIFIFIYRRDVEPRDFGVENPMRGPKSYMCPNKQNLFEFLCTPFFDCSTNPTLAVWEISVAAGVGAARAGLGGEAGKEAGSWRRQRQSYAKLTIDYIDFNLWLVTL